ncbi:MAG TPA: MFS transporter [Acidobacteriaceae bacterium]|nr:MFS transporter [Acidobacteriaceae bacterium]
MPDAETGVEQPPSRNLAAPHRFLWIVLPYAIYIGFTTNGGASYLLRQVGMPVDQVANAIALLGIPSSIYFLWSPLADLWMPRRWWHFLCTVGAAAAMAIGSYMLYRNAHAAVWLYFFGMVFCMLISSAYGGLISAMIAPPSRTRTAAWAQASNLGGGAIGPGLILYLALRLRPSLWVSLAAVLMVLPGLVVFTLKEPVHVKSPGFATHFRKVGYELRQTCLKRKNLFGLILLLAPPGAGALIGLLPALAPDYRVSGTSVVWINGIGGGLLMALGCLAGGWVPARIDRRVAYAVAGAVVAVPAAFIAIAPTDSIAYIVGTVAYLFFIGLTSTVCMGLVLDVVGAVGHSGSLRYSILMALSYVPIAYMTWIEGRAAHAWGFRAVPATEAVSCLFDLPLLLLWFFWRRKEKAVAA